MPIKRELFFLLLVFAAVVALVVNIFIITTVPALNYTLVKAGIFIGALIGMIGYANRQLKQNRWQWLRREE